MKLMYQASRTAAVMLTLFFLGLILAPNMLFAQDTAEPVLPNTIHNQFEELLRKSSSYSEGGNRYKVVRLDGIQQVEANVADSLQAYYNQIQKHNEIVAGINQKLEEQTTQMEQQQAVLDEAQRAEDSMSLFGIYMNKVAYNSMMWGIVIGLTVLLLIVAGMYKRTKSVINTAKQNQQDVEEELEKVRKNALVREQKLARELMDEKLKHKRV